MNARTNPRAPLTVIACVAGLLLTGSAEARGRRQGQRLSPEERFSRLDQDKDGNVTQAEFLAGMEARKAERAERRSQRRGQRLSSEERFAQLDQDKDGSVTQAELEAGIQARVAERSQRRAQRQTQREERWKEMGLTEEQIEARKNSWATGGAPGMGRGRRGRGQGSGRMGRRGPQFDLDGDGTLSSEELKAAVQKHLQRMDSDSDGAISADEFAAAAPFGRQGRRGRRGKRGRHGGRGGWGRGQGWGPGAPGSEAPESPTEAPLGG